MPEVRILIAEPARDSELQMWRTQLAAVGVVVSAPEASSEDELVNLISEADVVIVRRRRITRHMIDQGRNLKLIQKIGRRVENIDIEAAQRRGVTVRTALNPSWLGVAEHTMLLLFALAKQLRNADLAVRSGANPGGVPSQTTTETSYAYNWAQVGPLSLVYGRTLGVIGMGEIGQLVAERAKSLGMQVCYTRNSGPLQEAGAYGYQWDDLEGLIRRSDFISLHVPLTEETRGLIGARELGLMKKTAFLVNTSRGGVVDQDALVAALTDGEIAGAGLDVFVEEPLPSDHPLVGLDNVVLTPHIAAVRPETLSNPFPEVVENVTEVASRLGVSEPD